MPGMRPRRARPGPGSGGGPGPGSASGGGLPGSGGDPLAGVERVLIDGSNLAYALARGDRGRGGRGGQPHPNAGVIASVRVAFPAQVRVELFFDGSGEASLGRAGTLARAATNLFVEHAGRRSADRVIEEAVAAQLAADGPAGTWGILVVTDDRELRGLVQAKGARVAGTAWLAGRLARASAGVGAGRAASGTSIGHRRPPRGPGGAPGSRASRPPRDRC
jgi:hypothetical protein